MKRSRSGQLSNTICDQSQKNRVQFALAQLDEQSIVLLKAQRAYNDDATQHKGWTEGIWQ